MSRAKYLLDRASFLDNILIFEKQFTICVTNLAEVFHYIFIRGDW